MKKYLPLLCGAALAISPLLGEEVQAEPDMGKVSESFGHLVGKNLTTLSMDFDMELVIKGIRDSLAGKEAPLGESEVVAAISQVQEKQFQKQASDNLAKAEEFLEKNAVRPDVVELEAGKLQYKIEKAGSGELVKEDASPTIHYKGTFLNGDVFGESQNDEVISLKETIPGFSKGIAGMKEGETRILYIHPDMAYGNAGYLPPNSLLTFEIQVIKADTPQPELNVEEATADAVETEEMPKQ